MPTHFIELQDDGIGQYCLGICWDHLCQDVDPNKPNYVNNIADLQGIDINMIQGRWWSWKQGIGFM